jgi:hypothetical protein
MKVKIEMVFLPSILILVSVACGSSAPPQTVITTATPGDVPAVPTLVVPVSAPMGSVGETIIQGGYTLTLANVETAYTYGDFRSARAGSKFIAVELVFQSSTSTGVNVNPFFATIKEPAGYEYSPVLFGKDPSLKSQNNLPTGELVRGWVTFEVPESSSGFILTYSPFSFEGIKIRFDLGL